MKNTKKLLALLLAVCMLLSLSCTTVFAEDVVEVEPDIMLNDADPGADGGEITNGEITEPDGGETTVPTGGETNEPDDDEANEPTGGETNEPDGGETNEPTGGAEDDAVAEFMAAVEAMYDDDADPSVILALYDALTAEQKAALPEGLDDAMETLRNGVSTTATIDSGTCGANVTWIYDYETKQLTISGSGPMKDSASSTIGAPWYQKSYRTEIESIVIEEGVTTVGGRCFQQFTSLKTVQLPSTLESIGKCAFYQDGNLAEIDFPEGLKEIGGYAFQETALTKIVLPSTFEKIGDKTPFYKAPIESIEFKGSVKQITSDNSSYKLDLLNSSCEGITVIVLNADEAAYLKQVNGWRYNRATFAEPAKEYVAQIGDTQYETLAEAIDAAQDGDTVTMIADIKGMTTADIATVKADKDITLDMGGHRITVATDFTGRPIDNKGTLTVTGNGTIDSSAGNKGYGAIRNDGNLTIMDGTYIGNVYSDGTAIRNGIGSKLTVYGGYFAGTGAVYNVGEATIYKGEFETLACSGCSTPHAYALNNRDETGASGKMDILPEKDEDVKVHGTQGALSSVGGAEVYVKGGTFWTEPCAAKNHTGSTHYAVYVSGKVGMPAKCVIDGGQFSTSGSNACIYVENNNPSDNGGEPGKGILEINGGSFDKGSNGAKLIIFSNKQDSVLAITDGTFTDDVTEYCVEGYKAVLSSEDNLYHIVKMEYVAQVGENKYETLEAALTAAQNGDTVEIIVSGEFAPITVPAGVTVQAAEGSDVTFKATNDAKMTLNDGAALKNVTVDITAVTETYWTKCAAVYAENAAFTLDGCTFIADGQSNSMLVLQCNAKTAEITNCIIKNFDRGYYACGDSNSLGTLTISNNTFEKVRIPVDGYWGKPATDATKLTITGNTFTDGSYVQLWDYTQYAKSGGTALDNVIVKDNEGDYQLVLNHTNWAYATGSIETNAPKVVYSHHVDVDKGDQADVIDSITAKWAGEGEMPGFERQTTANADGFYHLPEGNYIATVTYKNGVVKTQDFTVTPQTVGKTQTLVLATDKYVAQIGETKYETLEAAVNAAKSGDTVELLADVELTGTLEMPAGMTLTIDGNGHKITPADGFKATGHSAAIAANANAPYNADNSYTLKNLTFEGFSDLIRVVRVNFCDALIDNCTFTGNTGNRSVITSAYGKVTVKNSVFTDNTADYAIIDIGSDVDDKDTHEEKATITGNRFEGNTAESNAVIFVLTPADITGNDFTGNKVGIAGIFAAADADITGNYFNGNTHIGTNPNAGAVLAGPWLAREYAINIKDNAFVDALSKDGKLPAVVVEDWSETYGTDISYDLSNNYWGGARPVDGVDYAKAGDTAAKVTISSYASRFTKPEGFVGATVTTYSAPTGGGTGGGGGGTVVTPGEVEIEEPDVPLAGGPELNKADHTAYISGYADGTVRPESNLTREEVATIFYRLLTDQSRAVYETNENSFSDVNAGRWSNTAISTLANAGIITGYADGTFRPAANVTRAELVAMAARFDDVTEVGNNPFSDTEGHWAENLISFAAGKGWVNGYADGTFRPDAPITRAEAMKLINNVLGRQVDAEGLLENVRQWPDNDSSKWYYTVVLEATTTHGYERRSDDSITENWVVLNDTTPVENDET